MPASQQQYSTKQTPTCHLDLYGGVGEKCIVMYGAAATTSTSVLFADVARGTASMGIWGVDWVLRITLLGLMVR